MQNRDRNPPAKNPEQPALKSNRGRVRGGHDMNAGHQDGCPADRGADGVNSHDVLQMPDDGNTGADGGKTGNEAGAKGVGVNQIRVSQLRSIAKLTNYADVRAEIADQLQRIPRNPCLQRFQADYRYAACANLVGQFAVRRAEADALISRRVEAVEHGQKNALRTADYAGVVHEDDFGNR